MEKSDAFNPGVLNRDQIVDEKSSTQLNRWVQEHVLKWVAWAEQRKTVTFQKPGDKEPYKQFRDWQSMKDKFELISYSEIDSYKHIVYGDGNFSSDIAAAWTVEEVFKDIKSKRATYTNRLKELILSDKGECDTYDLMHASPSDRCKAALLTELGL